MKKKILLTGATGFVGRHVLSNLLNKKAEVRVLVRKNKEKYIKEHIKKIELITTEDLFQENPHWLEQQCKDIDTIIHVAWYAEPKKYLYSMKNIDCLIGSLQFAKGAIKAGVRRFIGIGTCFEYDLNAGDLSVKTNLNPLTPYASAKTALYTSLLKFLPEHSIEFSWCRIFYLFGDGEDKRRLVPYLKNQLSNGLIAELNSGESIRDYLNVKDAARMIVDIALGKTLGPINICSGFPITIKELANKIADMYGRRDLLKFSSKSNNFKDPLRIVGVPNYNLE